ncbi:MAG: dephospho-CoA kinase [Vicinamibacterales bacterium]
MRTGRVALTGGIATGKSGVRAHFERLGVPTIDADTLAREAVAPGSPGLAAVVQRFGVDVLSGGALNRKALAEIVFADASARAALESIIHPIVRSATDAWFSALDPATVFAVADIPLLYEVRREVDFDVVVVAACDPMTQLNRLRARDGLDAEDARRRLAAQLPIEEKVRRADYVVRTDGSLEDTARATETVFQALRLRRWG